MRNAKRQMRKLDRFLQGFKVPIAVSLGLVELRLKYLEFITKLIFGQVSAVLPYHVQWCVRFFLCLMISGGVFFSFPGQSFSVLAQPIRDPRLPYPAELRFKVEFWKAVYTKYTTKQGLIHDSEDLSLIYDAVELPKNGDFYSVDYMRNRIRESLFNILRKRGDNLTVEERALLAKFPRGASRSRLLQATENIRFQLGQTDRFQEGLKRSGYYLKHIEGILKQEGLPDFLKYLPHVESSFQEYAISKFGAAGLWQLMPATGKQYLRIDYTIDQRLDPWVATRAAAKHLKGDYKVLGNWALALTAYNHGAYGMQRAMKSLGTSDIAEIAFRYSSPSFGFASRNFYAQFLAASEVASNYQKYFPTMKLPEPLMFDVVDISEPIYLQEFIKQYKFSMEEFQRLNPGLRLPVITNQRPIPKGISIRVPLNSKRNNMMIASAEPRQKIRVESKAGLLPQIRSPLLPAVKREKEKEANETLDVAVKYGIQDLVDGKGWINVEMNETVSQIADWLQVEVDEIRGWNGMAPEGQARLGQKILVKLSKTTAQDFVSARLDHHRKIREDFFSQYAVADLMDYEVKPGENLWSLCYQKFEVPPWLLAEYNPKISLNAISKGIKLKIPVLKEKSADLISSR